MNVRKLTNIANATIGALVKSMEGMGLDLSLIWSQLSKAFEDDHIKGILNDLGLEIEGNDVKSITESFGSEMMESGMIQRMHVTSADEDKIVIDLGDCVFTQAGHAARDRAEKIIPPCSMIAILHSIISANLNKDLEITDYEFKPETNSCYFTMKVEG